MDENRTDRQWGQFQTGFQILFLIRLKYQKVENWNYWLHEINTNREKDVNTAIDGHTHFARTWIHKNADFFAVYVFSGKVHVKIPGEVLLRILGGGVPPGSPNPDPISD